jgi:hypothetical protein
VTLDVRRRCRVCHGITSEKHFPPRNPQTVNLLSVQRQNVYRKRFGLIAPISILCSGCRYAVWRFLFCSASRSRLERSLIPLTFTLQSELSFEYRLPVCKPSSADKRQLHSSKQQRHQKQSVTVKFPLIHFDCAIAPSGSG